MEAMTGTNLLDQFEILVNPGAYDAHPPIPVFRMDYAPRVLSVDRLTVAVYLLFRPWISGELLVSKPMTPQLAEAIRQYSGFVDVAVRPIELRALPIISGRNSARAVVVDLLQSSAQFLGTDGSTIDLTLLRADQASGSLRTAQSATLVSNGFMLADGSEREAEVAAAVCCLVGEDFDLGEVEIPPTSRIEDLSRLVRNVGIVLR